MGIGENTLEKCVADASSNKLSTIKSLMSKHGDLGTVATLVKSKLRTLSAPTRLTIKGVYKSFLEIAKASGKAV